MSTKIAALRVFTLAAVISALRAAYLGGLDRLTIDTDGTRRAHVPQPRAFVRNAVTTLPQVPSSRHWAK